MTAATATADTATAAAHEPDDRHRLQSIQLLRALAALTVVTHHIPVFGRGAWGVDVFFVISGFIMCFITRRGERHFLRKRLIRVVPLYWLGTLGLFGITLYFPRLVDHSRPDVGQLLKSLFFVPFVKYDDRVVPLLNLGWTLNYEMFFYLLFAVALRLSVRHRAAICAALIGGLVALGLAFPTTNVVATFYTSTLLLEFVLGMACYGVYAARGAAVLRAVRDSRAARAGLLVVALAMVGLMQVVYPLVYAVIDRPLGWGVPSAVLFLAAVFGLSKGPLPAFAVLVGDASYNLYLFHPYVIQVFDKVFRAFATPGPGAYAMALLAVALCCLVAVLIYRGVERPLTAFLRARLPGAGDARPGDAP